MVGRRQAAPAFRPSAPAGPTNTPSRLQSVGLLAAVVVVALAISIVSFLVKPSRARSFDLFYGSVFINDDTSPVAIDLASGKPTVRLRDAFKAVSATVTTDLDLYPLAGGNTLMLRPSTGEFNMVDSTGFVVKTVGGGVQLPKAPAGSRTSVVPAGDSAYMLQTSAFRSSIYLVGQLTVASAIGAHAKAKARAYATIKAPLAAGSSPAASANDDLWLLTDVGPLVGADQQHAITQLTLPAGSNNGATLTSSQHGTVAGPAAVGTATINPDGTGGDVAAVASRTQLQIFAASGTVRVPIKVDGTVEDIMAASDAQGRLVFLYRTSTGWTEVTAPTDGSASAQVHQLTTISANAALVTPAESDGHLYTMDTTGTGDLWQIEADGSAHRIIGAPTYPVLPNEKRDLSQAQVFARGSRVIFNSRNNYDAEVVFSDGSHAPRRIYKHSAVQVDPSGATTLATGSTKHTKPVKPGTKPPKVRPPTRPAQPVNDKVDCTTTRQTPHIPIVQLGSVGSRSVQLQWTYPLLDPQDCAPSTYTVSTKLDNPDAPAPPGTITVNGQTGVTLTGLFPDTDYSIVVTAYLNRDDHTSAPAIPVHTSVEGPAAPTNLHTSVDDNGNWSINWQSCGGIKTGCVPVTSWQIIPRFCDGRGLSNAPQTISLVGDPTLHLWHYAYQGNDGLLGRGLSFTVEGIGTHGTIGAPASDNNCSYSWTNPVKSAISVAASAPTQTDTSQAQTDTTVSVSFADGAVHDLGGVDGELSYQLESNGAGHRAYRADDATDGQAERDHRRSDVSGERDGQPATASGSRGHAAAGAGRARLREMADAGGCRHLHQHQRDRRHADHHAGRRRCRHTRRDLRPDRQQLPSVRQRRTVPRHGQLPERLEQHHAWTFGVVPEPESIHLSRQLHGVDPARPERRHRDEPAALRRRAIGPVNGGVADHSAAAGHHHQGRLRGKLRRVDPHRTADRGQLPRQRQPRLRHQLVVHGEQRHAQLRLEHQRADRHHRRRSRLRRARRQLDGAHHLPVLPEQPGLHRRRVRHRTAADRSHPDQLRRCLGRNRAESRGAGAVHRQLRR